MHARAGVLLSIVLLGGCVAGPGPGGRPGGPDAASAPAALPENEVPAATPDTSALFAAIAGHDSALFDAFNRCDAAALETFFTEDLEFYHDYGGLISPRRTFIDGFADGCRKNEVGRRELVAGSMEVHPVRGVGAIQIGVHRFFVRTPGGGETPGAVARFVMLWRNTDAGWKISRVLSFDHRT